MSEFEEDAAALLTARLRIDEVIGRGGFGVVYRGRQLGADRDVAIKVLRFAAETEPARLFFDEIRAIGTISHNHVVRLYDAGSMTDGRLYCVMELLSGPTLAEHGPLPIAQAVALVGQLLDGLEAVHAAGYVHADVKPSNAIVVAERGRQRVVLIDFGLARLLGPGGVAEAVGGTPPYMAPEQLSAWAVDARSDVFSAALVLLRLVTGWQRTSRDALVPPLDGVADPVLRAALERALALDGAARPSAAAFARALRGEPAEESGPPGPPPPFREHAPLTERDRGRLHGRSADVEGLARKLEAGRAVVFTAPSGTGKTSLLRAGLVPYLDAQSRANVYVACEPGVAGDLRLRVQGAMRDGRVVVILDQVEALLVGEGASEGEAMIAGLLESEGVAVVLAVREDFVARLLAVPPLTNGAPQLRLRPLDRAGARAALVEPLLEHGCSIEDALLERLLDDLVGASRTLRADVGWTADSSVFPPQLALAGSALYDALGEGERTVTLAHYERLGGFEAIVGDHLERSLQGFTDEDQAIAHDLFLLLIASGQTRAIRTEADLFAATVPRHGDAAVRAVLRRLEAHRLLARRSGSDGATWTLLHDTLVPRIAAWQTVHDLERRTAAEMLRFHLRQSLPESPSLLSRKQLRTVRGMPDLVDELDANWGARPETAWTPRRLVDRSAQVVRYRSVITVTVSLVIVALIGMLFWFQRNRLDEARLSALNLGKVDLEIEPFEWQRDVATGPWHKVSVDAATLPGLTWGMYEPNPDDPYSRGVRIVSPRLENGTVLPIEDGLFVERGVEVRGGDAFIAISGRGGTCADSIVPLRGLPGYVDRDHAGRIHLDIPTCAASAFDTVPVAEGEFIFGGLGEPAATTNADLVPEEATIPLPRFSIDRTEIPVSAYAVFVGMSQLHQIVAMSSGGEPSNTREFAQGGMDWFEARAYCRFMGKELPSSRQWQKALRGGTVGNPFPRRNYPWGTEIPKGSGLPAAIAVSMADCGKDNDKREVLPIAAFPNDVSPYGVLDLAGGVQEWTNDLNDDSDDKEIRFLRRSRLTRGGDWYDTDTPTLAYRLAIQNLRTPMTRLPYQGARCVTIR